MLWSRLLILSLAMSFFSFSALAVTPAELSAKICDQMLGVTLIKAEPLPEFNVMEGLGLKGFLGAYPDPLGAEAAHLASAGLMYWGHSFAVKKSVEEARAHDSNHRGLSKIMYLISDVDVSDLKSTTADDIIQARFSKVFASAKMVYWDDSEAIINKDDSIPAKYVEMDMDKARRLIIPETIGYTDLDDRGPRFKQSGWDFPKIRGQLKYATVFDPNAPKIEGVKSIASVIKDAEKLLRKGFTVTFNQNFQEALDMARDQIRIEKVLDENGKEVLNAEGKSIKKKSALNSRYREPMTYAKALEGYRAGHSFSVELRDPNNRLVGVVLGERHGNIINLETVAYEVIDRPDGSFVSMLDYAKICVVAALQRMHDYGIDMADAGMVTPFTALMRGQYFWAQDFARDVEFLRSKPVIEIDFTRPWTPQPIVIE